jgi:tRNA(His) guanylyltransferase
MSMDFENLGDLQKDFEREEAGRSIMPGIPVLARLDGRGFSKFTEGMKRPYDLDMGHCMKMVSRHLLEESNAKLVYTQSDEITLCWPNTDEDQTKIFFNGKYQKLCSILAAIASVRFNTYIQAFFSSKRILCPVFDCRVWQVPSLDVAANNFLWREMDATKNSISMAASEYYTSRELMHRSSKERLRMLESKGVDWTKYPDHFKRGSYFKKVQRLVEVYEDDLRDIPEKYRPTGPILRNLTETMTYPKATSIVNFAGVLFRDEEPRIDSQEKTIVE